MLPFAIVPRAAVPLCHNISAVTANGDVVVNFAFWTNAHFIQRVTMWTVEFNLLFHAVSRVVAPAPLLFVT